MLLAVSGGSLALGYLVIGRPVWVLVLVIPTYILLQFSFYIVTPRLLLDLPFAWRDLAPGAAVSTGAAILVSAVSSFRLHRWFSAYGKAYGGFGIGLGIIACRPYRAFPGVDCSHNGCVLEAQGRFVCCCRYA
jgi:uncharacterized BrkB/YihY/UPF0761 family membrane protein